MWLQQHLYTEHLPAAPALNFRGAARLRPLAGDWPPAAASTLHPPHLPLLSLTSFTERNSSSGKTRCRSRK
ncbi:unnamed protein product [Staurois parvus]|uniref:Uncharacterized protein n=1 Tax=Staurois parvus TaxID=386267 RepID=A0ABN9EVY0_9NEOB|nr:unnamed protein product [Staurois parvus]